jgi:hypothetical protein
MRTETQRSIYGRHAGPYSLLLTRESGGKQFSDHLAGPYSAEEAHEEARKLVADPKGNTIQVFVNSITEGQFIGALYERGKRYASWTEMRDAEGAALDAEKPEAPSEASADAAEVPAVKKAMAPKLEAKAPRAPRSRGGILELDPGNAERWPNSKGAALVRSALEELGAATAADLAARLAEPLKAANVAFPASLISRLKQAGLLRIKE